ncbi:MAG: sugar transferase [Candidatus Muiribacteriota bacterium]
MKFILFILDLIYYFFSGYFIINRIFQPENVIAFGNIWYFILIYKIFFNYFFDLFEDDNECDSMLVFFRAFQSSLISALVVVFTTFYLRNFALPRSFILVTAILDIVYVFFSRKFLINYKKKYKVCVVCSSEKIYNFIEGELKDYNADFDVFKTVSDFNVLKDIIKNRKCNILIFSSPVNDEFNNIMRLLWYAEKNRVKIFLYPDFSNAFTSKVNFSGINGLPLVRVGKSALRVWEKFFKRFLDIIISVSVLFLLIPVLPLLAFIIKFGSKGPVFYVQKRVGFNNKIFNLIKFRTMINEAESNTGPKLAEVNDIRITKTGKILRKFRIDELPQFINVLKGDMSIVGPRPEREIFVKKYYQKLPGYFLRTMVKPGITGLAQIFGGYYTRPEEKLKFDFLYINNYSLFLDIKIIFMTIFRIVFQRKE